MTLFFTPRMESASSVSNGWYPRESHGGVLRKKIEEQNLHRVRVQRKRLNELKGGALEIQTLPEKIQQDLRGMEVNAKARMESQFKEALLAELKDLLKVLESTQIDAQKMTQIWNRVQEEELALWMVMT